MKHGAIWAIRHTSAPGFEKAESKDKVMVKGLGLGYQLEQVHNPQA